MAFAATILAVIGALTLLILTVRLFRFLAQHLVADYSFAAYKSTWAVVTGASGGIGAGFVRALAARGLNVVLLARSEDAMDALASEVRAAHGVLTRVHRFDFAAAGDAEYAHLADALRALPVSVLVNNVGVNVEFPTEFGDMAADDVARIVRVNVAALNCMTAMLLPAMRAARRGLVLNLSSGGGAVTPAPLLAVYAGTKAYADAFAVSLAGEVGAEGVLVRSLTPFFVESAMAKMRRSFTVPSADDFARKALKQVGTGVRISPHWVHGIIGGLMAVVPLEAQVKYVANLHRSIRARALKKKERMAKQN